MGRVDWTSLLLSVLDSQRQQLELAHKLEQRRLRRIHQLNEKHEQEKALLVQKSDKSTDTANFIEVCYNIY